MGRYLFAMMLVAASPLMPQCNWRSHSVPTQVAQEKRERPLLAPAANSPLTVGGKPLDVALGDVNGDGKVDLVLALEGSRGLSVMLNDGRGGFKPAPGSPFDGGIAADKVALGDANKDGSPDIAFTNHDSLTVAVVLGKGDGSFTPAHGSPFTALRATRAHNHGLAFGDFNGDGNPDITAANQDDNSVSLLLGDGRGGFAPATGSPFAVGRSPYPQAHSDVNLDGRLDIVTPNVAGGSVSVLLGDGKSNFSPAPGSPIPVAARPFYVAAGDFNGDGKPDLVASHDDITLLTILFGDGRGRFTPAPASPLDLKQRAFEVVLADMNGDGKADMVVSTISMSNHVAVLLGDGRGGFRHAAGSPFTAGRESYSIAVGDINGDGRKDVITANSGGRDLTVLLGQ